MLEGEAIAAFRASPLKAEPQNRRNTNQSGVSHMNIQPWLVWQSGLGWIMQTLWVTLKLILDQTMLEGESIAAFRASPLHGGTTKIVV